MGFTLHERLRQDCLALGDFPLSRLLLMNDSRFPWCILVPAREGVTEIHQLEWDDQVQLLRESGRLSQSLTRLYQPDKLNIAAIGNLVPQLHLHHVVRYRDDVAWPAPVWGKGSPARYTEAQADSQVSSLRASLGEPGPEGIAFNEREPLRE
jgi:diadenosine tetraphosphate (Ap4A) HIT family hydrolase